MLCKFDTNLCLEILDNWMLLVDENGYLAREQARGYEISSKIPHEFQIQDGKEANPPTLLYPIIDLIELKNIDPFERLKIFKFIEKNYKTLMDWLLWFLETQSNSGNVSLKTKFLWYCKGKCESGFYYGSGLDDYPRHDTISHSKSHLDLHCWIIFFYESMTKISKYLLDSELIDSSKKKNYINNLKVFENDLKILNQSLWNNFFDKDKKIFFDQNFHLENYNDHFIDIIGNLYKK